MFCDICQAEQPAGVYFEAGSVVTTPGGTRVPLDRYLRVCWSCLNYQTIQRIVGGRSPQPPELAGVR